MLRTSLYEKFYDRDYKFASANKKTDLSSIEPPLGDEEPPMPIDPFERSTPTKPYRPPTDFDGSSNKPFGSILDAPLN